MSWHSVDGPSNPHVSIWSMEWKQSAAVRRFCTRVRPFTHADSTNKCPGRATPTGRQTGAAPPPPFSRGRTHRRPQRHPPPCRAHNDASTPLMEWLCQNCTHALPHHVLQMITLNGRYQYAKSDIIGSGTYGDVYLAMDLKTKKQCVLKVARESEQMTIQKLQNEAKQLEQLKHPNIAHGFDHFVYDNEFYIAMDYYENSDLQNYIGTHGHPDVNLILMWLAQIASALNYLHSQRIIHRDIKIQNIFVDGDLNVFLGDFGTAKELSKKFACTFIGTPQTMAPEVIAEQPYCCKTDMWSVGCVLYELLEHHPPFISTNMMGMMKIISEGRYQPVQLAGEDFRYVIQHLLIVDPATRWDSYQLCNHLTPQLQALQLPQPVLVENQVITHQLNQVERTLVMQYNNIQDAVNQSQSAVKSQTMNSQTKALCQSNYQQLNALSEFFQQKIYRKLFEILQDEDLLYNLIIAYTFLLSRESVGNICHFLNIQEIEDINTGSRDLVEQLNQEEHLLEQIVRKVKGGQLSDLQTKEVVILIKKIGLMTFLENQEYSGEV